MDDEAIVAKAGACLPLTATPAPKCLNDHIRHHTKFIIGTTRNGRLALATSTKVTFIDLVTSKSQVINLGTSTRWSPRLVASCGDAVFTHDRHYRLMLLRLGAGQLGQQAGIGKTVGTNYHYYVTGQLQWLHPASTSCTSTGAWPRSTTMHRCRCMETLEVESCLPDHLFTTP